MITLLLTSFLTSLAKDKPLWVELVGMLIPVGLAVWGFVRAFRAWERQKKREIDLLLDRQRYEQKLQACLGVWSLLAYLSGLENEKTVFVRRDGSWYFRRDQGRDFLANLPEIFYTAGHGVFMPKEVRNGLYEFRGIVYKMLDAFPTDDSKTGDRMLVKNQDIIEVIPKLFQRLNKSLRLMLVDSKIEFSE